MAPTLETETKGSWFRQHVIRVNPQQESHKRKHGRFKSDRQKYWWIRRLKYSWKQKEMHQDGMRTKTHWAGCRRVPFDLFLYLCSAVGIVKMMKQHCKTWKRSHWCVSVSISVINVGRLVIVLIECLCSGVGATVGLSSILFSSVVLVCGSCRPADVCAGINIVGDIDLGACTQSYIQLSCGGLTNHHKSASVREHQGWCEHPPGRSSVMSARASLCFLGCRCAPEPLTFP